MKLTANDFEISFVALRRVVYGKNAYISFSTSARSKKIYRVYIDHGVARRFKVGTGQSRYPLCVLAAVVTCGDKVVAINRNPSIFVPDLTKLDERAQEWVAHLKATAARFGTMIEKTYGDWTFDGEFLIDDKHSESIPMPLVNCAALSVAPALNLGRAYEYFRNQGLNFSKFPKTFHAATPVVSFAGHSFTLRKTHVAKIVKEEASVSVKTRDMLTRHINEGRITLQTVETFASLICTRFGYEYMEQFDLLSVIDTLKTIDLTSLSSSVKGQFYTDNTVGDVFCVLSLLVHKAGTVRDVDCIRRLLVTMLQRGYGIVDASNSTFLALVGQILKPGKTVEDVHMLDYDNQYQMALLFLQ